MAQEVPFTASPYDSEPHGREVFQKIVAGQFGEIAPFESPPSTRPMPAEAVTELEAFTNAPHVAEHMLEIRQHNEEIASGSSRGIAAHAEAILSQRLMTLLVSKSVSAGEAKKMTFAAKIRKAALLDVISATEKAALNLIRKIRNEVCHGKSGTFYSESVRLLTNDLHKCLRNNMTYKPTASVDNKWIDLIFIDAYTDLDLSLEARANPNIVPRILR
jgi:hypothetical protein